MSLGCDKVRTNDRSIGTTDPTRGIPVVSLASPPSRKIVHGEIGPLSKFVSVPRRHAPRGDPSYEITEVNKTSSNGENRRAAERRKYHQNCESHLRKKKVILQQTYQSNFRSNQILFCSVELSIIHGPLTPQTR